MPPPHPPTLIPPKAVMRSWASPAHEPKEMVEAERLAGLQMAGGRTIPSLSGETTHTQSVPVSSFPSTPAVEWMGVKGGLP